MRSRRPIRTMLMTSLVAAYFVQPSVASAQEPPATEPAITQERRDDTTAAELGRGKAVDKTFLALGGALNGAMLLDTKSTFDTLGRCARCAEANPFVAPFIRRGPAVAVTAAEAFDIGVMAVAAKMRTARGPVPRRIWWVVPVVLTTGHLVAYRHNLTMAR